MVTSRWTGRCQTSKKRIVTKMTYCCNARFDLSHRCRCATRVLLRQNSRCKCGSTYPVLPEFIPLVRPCLYYFRLVPLLFFVADGSKRDIGNVEESLVLRTEMINDNNKYPEHVPQRVINHAQRRRRIHRFA